MFPPHRLNSKMTQPTMDQLPGLLQLPDELLDSVISQLASPSDTVHFGLTCKHAHALVGTSLVWRRHCLARWQHWAPQHELPAKLVQPPLHTDWRQLCGERVSTDRAAAGMFESLLLSQQNRVQHMQEIAAKGYDVQDLLLRLKNETPDEAEDVLARRWHAEAILGIIHRSRAVGIWWRLHLGDDITLEEALSANDIFVLGVGRPEIYKDVKIELDRHAQRIRETAADFDELSTRQRAVTMAEYLIARGLVGNPDPATYHALRNNFISVALFDEPHTSLPLQSVAIYCAVARRLGVDARPSNVPGHVLAVVAAPPGQSLEGEPDTSDRQRRMHMDPWRQSNEVTPDELSQRLINAGVPPYRHNDYVGGADTLEMVLRASRNILRSVESARLGSPSQLDVEAAQYSALWSKVILGDSSPALATPRRLQCLQFLIVGLQKDYPEDCVLVREKVLPLLEGLPEHDLVSEFVEHMREDDAREKIQQPRGERESRVQYRIGHYFQHRRYQYRGFIVGWDANCVAGPGWIERMGVDDLPGGRGQPFYNIVGADRSSRYVAEENIQLLDTPPSQDILRLAGRFFKRWDANEKRFVSNIRDEYPDD